MIALLAYEPPPLAVLGRQSWYPWIVVGLVSMGGFIGQLDATIVQLALPNLGKTFDATLESVSWVSLGVRLAARLTSVYAPCPTTLSGSNL